MEGTKEDCSSKSVGELCAVGCVSGCSNSVDLPQIFLCESNESLLHIWADGGSNALKLDNSVVSRHVHSQGALGYALRVGDTEQTFSC